MKRFKVWRIFLMSAILFACKENSSLPSKELVSELPLKRGDIISCGPSDKDFGSTNFTTTCDNKILQEFNVGVELLHSFEYDEAEKAFAKIIDESPGCAMAYWGIAMCSYHPLWEPPTEADLIKGSKAIAIAETITPKSERESDFIKAIAAYYKDWSNTGHTGRSLNFEKAMEHLHNKYPGDTEAAIFYSLALVASSDVKDKLYVKQKKAGAILEELYKKQPNHPGIIHYIIHTYDYPGIANLALPAARRYAQVAPSSAHALHMPSHIFTRLGMWDECVQSNLNSVAAADCYAKSAGIKGHWDEELHGLDYLVYAYLQKGDSIAVKKQLDYIASINDVYPINFKVAYTFSASPAREVLENKKWKEAAALQLHPNFPWHKFPWQEAIIHFSRLLGSTKTGNTKAAQSSLVKLNSLYDTLLIQKDLYKSNQVAIQIKIGEAWILYNSGKKPAALNLMRMAAELEDSTSKHPVTPGEVLPARELYADMLLQMEQTENALQEYEKVLQKSPNRLNSLYGAGFAANKSGLRDKTIFYFKQLSTQASQNSTRQEVKIAKEFLAR